MPTVKNVMACMEHIAPSRFALEGDPIGLVAGSRHNRVSKIHVALDVLPATVAEAVKSKAQMLIAHHPPFYRGFDAIDEDERKGELAALIARNKLAVFSAHTNLDIADGGVADCLADAVGLSSKRKPLSITGSTPFLKLAVFVPATHLEKVRKAICNAGAGQYGEYSDCTFRVRGTGTFKGSEAANPFIGKPGKLEEADEYRLETRLLQTQKREIEKALLKAHPYEVPACDFTRLDESIPHGLGRIADLERTTSVKALARRLAKNLHAPGVQVCGKDGTRIRRVAVWSGSGAPVSKAVRAGAEVLVTGECGYHDADDSAFFNLPVIRLGHGVSERPVLPVLAKVLRKKLHLKVSISRDPCARFRNA